MPQGQRRGPTKAVPAPLHPSEGSMMASPLWERPCVPRRTGARHPPGQGNLACLPDSVRPRPCAPLVLGARRPSARTPLRVGCSWVACGHFPASGPAPHVSPRLREACDGRRALLAGPGTRGSEGRRQGALCPQRPITGEQDGTSTEEFLTRLSWSRPRAQHGLLLGEVTVTNEETQVHVLPEKVQNGNAGQHCLGAPPMCPRCPSAVQGRAGRLSNLLPRRGRSSASWGRRGQG